MAFGRRAAFSCLILSWLACSTEDTGLYSYDATIAPQGVEEPDPPPPKKPPAMADAHPSEKADAAAPSVDAPAVTDVGPDLTPDLPAPIDQALGVACARDGECKSGHCFTGVCCDSACSDGCSACTQARTGKSDGTCAPAPDLAGKVCGKGCSTVATVPSLVEKVCSSAGACVIPAGKPTVIESCHDSDPCVVSFCDDNDARCVRTSCGQGSCCCRSSSNDRMCMRQDACHGGGKTCE
jgi:hypothetical protein